MYRIAGVGFMVFLLLSGITADSQNNNYILNGSAVKNNCYCYTLTDAFNFQAGSVWNINKISLDSSFDFAFNVFAGCKDANGADGLVFILQPISTSIGTAGEGIGFSGVSPSIGIALDTYQNLNLNDPDYDHISIQANGNSDHNFDLAGPVPISPFSNNIEDCQWHTMRIKWDANSKLLQAYYDAQLRVEKQVDMVKDIFNNDPLVYWGFTAATGGLSNIQRFCTALNPKFSTSVTGNRACVNISVKFKDESESFTPVIAHYWDFGDGGTSVLPNPTHTYLQPGTYYIKSVITGFDGCVSDTLKQPFYVGDKPEAAFKITDSCSGKSLGVTDISTVNFGVIDSWSWILNGQEVSSTQVPDITGYPLGITDLSLVTSSDYGCVSDTVSGSFVVIPSPIVDPVLNNGCKGDSLNFYGVQTDNKTNIISWQWRFPDNETVAQKTTRKAFTEAGIFPIELGALSDNGCTAVPAIKNILINEVKANAGNDSLVVENTSFTLSGSSEYIGNVPPEYFWSPGVFLNSNTGPNPVANIADDQLFTLTVTSAEGCIDTNSVFISVFKGSAIYVPTGFTPNNDGLNDVLHPLFIGIKRLDYFNIYGRAGNKVFETKDMAKGWDGRINGILQNNGTYIWILNAEDIVGKRYQLKGTITIIK